MGSVRNLLDLIQPKAEPSSLGDKYEQRQGVVGVDAVTGRRAAGRRQDACPFIQPKRLAADAALRRYLTDQHPAHCHGWRVNPPPWGKVKRICNPPSATKHGRIGCSDEI
jgi:hypothetical protein